MAQIIEHIDKIARDKKRDVIYVVFDEPKKSYNRLYEKNPIRIEFIKWLEENQISYQMCAPFARENGWEAYRGQLYIDIPMDINDQRYLKLNEHLEDKNGTMKIKGINYYYLPLSQAMQNAHHDEVGFWDKWAEDFF